MDIALQVLKILQGNIKENQKMKNSKTFLFVVLLIIASLACSTLNSAPADSAPQESSDTQPTAVPTNTAIPATATKKPTNTPRPTNTSLPPTATAAPVGVPSSNSDYEVTVLYARYFAKVFSGGFEYTPLGVGKFLDVGVVIKNLQPGTRTVAWQDIYVIIVKENQGYYPNFGGSFVANNNENFDPATLFLFPEDNFEDIVFDDIVYIRGIWATDGSKPATYYFGFDTSPVIEIVMD